MKTIVVAVAWAAHSPSHVRPARHAPKAGSRSACWASPICVRPTTTRSCRTAYFIRPACWSIGPARRPPSRLYVWDSGNNRILGFDHVGRCVGGPAATRRQPRAPRIRCAAAAARAAPATSARPAAIVIGQPSGYNEGACNGDNTKTAPARADSLCAIPYPYQISPLEGPRANQMAVRRAHTICT